MSRLDEIIVFTPLLDRMRHFYERGIGLKVREELADWVQFENAGVHFALHATWEGHERETALVFEVPDFEAAIEAVRRRGVDVTIEERPELFERLAWFRDPEGNLVDLHPPGARPTEGRGPAMPRLLLNCRDFSGTLGFYREALGLPVIGQDDAWAELDAGGVTLAIHTMHAGDDRPLHAAQGIVFGFESDDVAEWVDLLHDRGVAFATAITEEDWGTFAEAQDPDGNVVLFRQPPAPPTLEEELAEEYEDDAAPRVAAIRAPAKRGAKAVSRVAVKPAYKSAPSKARKRPSATTQAVVKVRGAGPDRARATPKRTADEKKARGKVAIGRAKKATATRRAGKKKSEAGASKRKPVKRASARKGRVTRAAKKTAKRGRRR